MQCMSRVDNMKKSIGIIGAGAVGTTLAYSLITANIPTDIILVDNDTNRCYGEFLDLSDSLPLNTSSTSLKTGTISDLRTADIIVIAAGSKQQPGQSREDLLTVNKQVVKSVIDQLIPINPATLLIMVTNPVDTLTRYALALSSLPSNQVCGSGTYLDSLRLRKLISDTLHISAESIHVDIYGEHGDLQTVAWSTATVNGTSLSALLESRAIALHKKTRDRASEIISCKGATCYGIGRSVADLCALIIFDQKKVVPLSIYDPASDVCYSMPCIVGESGFKQFLPVTLTSDEQENLHRSITKLKTLWQTIGT